MEDMEKLLTAKPGLLGREPIEFVEMFEKGISFSVSVQ